MWRAVALVLLLVPVRASGQTVVIRDRAEQWREVLGNLAPGRPPLMVHLGAALPGGGSFNLATELRQMLREEGFRVIAGEDLEVGAECVVLQCMASVGQSRGGVTPFAYYERVYHWDSRQREIFPVWEAFGLSSSAGLLQGDVLALCLRELVPVLRNLGYGK